MRPVLVPGLVVLVLAMSAACGGGNTPNRNPATPPAATVTPLSSGQSSQVPTLVLTATPLVVGPNVRYCRGSDLQVAQHAGGATQYAIQSIFLANRSDTPCQIGRLPQLQFLNAAGSVVPINTQSGDDCQPKGSCRTRVPVLLLPGIDFEYVNGMLRPGLAVLTLLWAESQLCSTPPSSAGAARIKLVLDGGYYLIVDVTASVHVIAPCGAVQVYFFGPSPP